MLSLRILTEYYSVKLLSLATHRVAYTAWNFHDGRLEVSQKEQQKL